MVEAVENTNLKTLLRLYPRALAYLYTVGAVQLEQLARRGGCPSPHQGVEGWLDVKIEVERRLRLLDERLRLAVTLYYLRGHRQREVARRLGVSQPRLSRLLRRACLMMDKC